MKSKFLKAIEENSSVFYSFMNFLSQRDKKLCVTGNIIEYLNEFTEKHGDSSHKIESILFSCQESLAISDSISVSYTHLTLPTKRIV